MDMRGATFGTRVPPIVVRSSPTRKNTKVKDPETAGCLPLDE